MSGRWGLFLGGLIIIINFFFGGGGGGLLSEFYGIPSWCDRSILCIKRVTSFNLFIIYLFIYLCNIYTGYLS